MDDYLTKPLRPQTLRRALERWLKGVAVCEQPMPETTDALAEASEALLQLFLEHVPVQLEQLDGAVALGELDEVRRLAHKIKGSLLTVGADELANLAQSIQHAIERDHVADAEVQLETLVQGVVELDQRVRAELAARGRARRAGAHG
jgi:HPt (histidine-containing phosphotransfer) domain-containing protein